MTFKPLTTKDLLEQPDETGEQGYRRGYRDGYIAALQAVYQNRAIPAHLWQHWQETLLAWERGDTDSLEIPPDCPGPSN